MLHSLLSYPLYKSALCQSIIHETWSLDAHWRKCTILANTHPTVKHSAQTHDNALSADL